MRILRLVHENRPWVNARRSSYAIHQGLDEQLRRLGHEVVTFNSFHYPYLLRSVDGQYFDQVWWDLNQTTHPLDKKIGGLLAHCAPIRLGLFPESLDYLGMSLRQEKHVRYFRGWVESKLPYLTHIAMGDEKDVPGLVARGVKARFWPQGVPIELMNDAGPGEGLYFFGTLHETRRDLMTSHPAFDSFRHHPSSEAGSALPLAFDFCSLIAKKTARFALGRAPLIRSLGHLRATAYRRWLRCVGCSQVVLSLPSVFRGHPGRVTEALSQARPVLAPRPEGRPQTEGLFEDGKEILLYSDTDELSDLASRVKGDPEWAREVGRAGLRRMRSCYGLEKQVRELLQWISS